MSTSREDAVIDVLQPARRSGLADEVTDSLRQAIFDGVFGLGDRLGENEIAQRLDVSRGPVRQALMQLRTEGIVTVELHRGAAVVTLEEDDINELTSLRTTLESFAIALAAAHADDDDFARMDAVLQQMSAAIAAGDTTVLSQLDIRFHDAIYDAAHHDRLTRAWSTIRSQWLLFLLRRSTVNRDYLEIALDEHRALVEVIRSGDVPAAQSMIEEHVRGASERLLGSLRQGR